MKILHILRSKPDDVVSLLMDRISRGESNREASLYLGGVDYAKLVQDIFDSDMVICWW